MADVVKEQDESAGLFSLDFALVILGVYCGVVGISVLTPFFPKEAEAKQVDPMFIGLIFSCFQIASIVFTPYVSRLIVAFGPRRLLIFGNAGAGFANVVLSCCWMLEGQTTFIVVCCLLRLLAGASCAIYVTTTFAIMPLMVGKANLSTATGLNELSNGLAFITGPTLGSALYAISGGSEGLGYVVPFLTLGLVEIACAVLNAKFMSPMPMPSEKKKIDILGGFSWKVYVPAVTCGLVGFTFILLQLSISLHLTAPPLELPVGSVGPIFSIAAFTFALVSPLVGFVDDATEGHRSSNIMAAGGLCAALSFVFLAPAPVSIGGHQPTLTMAMVYFCMVGCGMSMALVYVPIVRKMLAEARHEDDETRRVATATLFEFSWFVGGALGPLYSGYSTQALSTRACYSQVSLGWLLWTLVILFCSLSSGASDDGAAAAALKDRPQYGTV